MQKLEEAMYSRTKSKLEELEAKQNELFEEFEKKSKELQ